MRCLDAISDVRTIRDDALSIKHLFEPPEQGYLDIAAACEQQLDYLNAFSMFYDANQPITKENYLSSSVEDPLFRAFQERTLSDAEEKQFSNSFTHAELEKIQSHYREIGFPAPTQPAYLAAPEILEANEVEAASLFRKARVQAQIVDCLEKNQPVDAKATAKTLYPLLRDMTIGAVTTGWQLHELDAINQMLGEKSLRNEIDFSLRNVPSMDADYTKPVLTWEHALMEGAPSTRSFQHLYEVLTASLDHKLAYQDHQAKAADSSIQILGISHDPEYGGLKVDIRNDAQENISLFQRLHEEGSNRLRLPRGEEADYRYCPAFIKSSDCHISVFNPDRGVLAKCLHVEPERSKQVFQSLIQEAFGKIAEKDGCIPNEKAVYYKNGALTSPRTFLVVSIGRKTSPDRKDHLLYLTEDELGALARDKQFPKDYKAYPVEVDHSQTVRRDDYNHANEGKPLKEAYPDLHDKKHTLKDCQKKLHSCIASR